MKEYGKQGVSINELIAEQMAKAERTGRTIDRETAYEELVADSMETMLNSGKVLQNLANLRQHDRTLAEKLRDWFRDFTQKLKGIVNAYKNVEPDTVEGRLVADMKDVISTFEALYGDALLDAAENFDSRAQKNTAQERVDGRNSAIKRSERIVDQIRSSLDKIMALDTAYEITAENATPFTSDRKTDEKSGNDVFKAQGSVANRLGFGRVVLSKRGAVHTVHHGNGPAKQASFPAIKAVIEQGIEIYRDVDHEGRGFDTVTFSAPIKFFGNDAPLAAVVKVFNSANADKTFYIHEICDAEGNYIQFSENGAKTKNSSTNFVEPTSTVSAADNGIAPKNSIRNPDGNVNRKLSTRDPAQQKIREVLEQENAQLREDVERLRELVKLQREGTAGAKFTKTSVEAAARMLKKHANAKQAADTKELAKLLHTFYEAAASD